MAQITKKRKKSWVKIIAPREFRNAELGESLVYSPQDLIGKRLNVNLSTLIGDMRKQNTNILFKIEEIKGSQAIANIISFEILPAHIKRMVRTLKDRIDDSFVVSSKDHPKIRIKPFVLTKAKTSNSILTLIRKRTREEVTKIASKSTFAEFTIEVISGQLKKQLKQELNKIYPITIFEIRKIELLK
ncbi:MAG: hypothetical protein AABX08_03660 [Nanoarchaeota archaeon]